MKKNDTVKIPKGTKFIRSSTTLLDQTPIDDEMHYSAYGKVDTLRENGIVSIAIWDAGRSMPWYCNVKMLDISLTNEVLLGYDRKRDVLTWTFPDGAVFPKKK